MVLEGQMYQGWWAGRAWQVGLVMAGGGLGDVTTLVIAFIVVITVILVFALIDRGP